MCQVVKQFMDLEVLWDYKSVADIKELISEGCPFNAPHVNILCELFGKRISLISSDNGIKEGLVCCNV